MHLFSEYKTGVSNVSFYYMPPALSLFVCNILIFPRESFFIIMLSQPEMMEKSLTNQSRKIIQIRQKIKEILGWDCAMNDDILLQRYTVTSDGDLIVIVK
jgi:hypothetical protein